MTVFLIVLMGTLGVIVLGVTVAAVRNGVSATDESAVDELTARIAQQRRHSSQVQQRQRSR